VKRALAALALLSLAACGGGDTAPDESLASACRPEIFEDSPLTHCMADPAIHTVRTALQGADGKVLGSVGALAMSMGEDARRVAFAMNGGMYDDAGRPIGYYVEDGERLQRLNRNPGPGNFHLLPNGVFFGTDGEWQVMTSEDFAETVEQRPGFATQSGPMLLIDGELHPDISPDGASRKLRNAVGVDDAGKAHFVISEAPLSMGKLARFYRDVLNVENALFLDGTVSQLWDPAKDRIDSGIPVGPLIVVERKD
jgi:uncharacterized protein YigE (DUF2233 family)